MNQPTLSPASREVLAVVLKMVNESRQRMNSYSDTQRESLETKAREFINGCDSALTHCHLG